MAGKIIISNPGGEATKEFFTPCTYAPGGDIYAYGCYPVAYLSNLNDYALVGFCVPHDYNSIVVASILVVPLSTQAAANWDISSNYAQTGESYQTHSESDTTSTYNVTDNQIFEVNIAGILTNLAINDIVGIKFLLSSAIHDVSVLGVRFKYL